MKDKKKVLLLTNFVTLYRAPIFELINKAYDLTVAFIERDDIKEDTTFRRMYLKTHKVKSLRFASPSFYKTCNQFDAVIFISNLHYICFCSLPFLPHKPKLLTWNIGIRASYTLSYDLNRKKTFTDRVFFTVNNRCDACIVYMPQAIDFNRSYGIDENKYFVAHNTVEVLPIAEAENKTKDSILFVGTLYKQKNIYELVNAYAEAYERNPNIPLLQIVGNGEEFNNLKRFVAEKNLGESIKLLGKITDEHILRELFARSFLCVSPSQAGLSVLKSMGYGVPFVTHRDAITGGERLNIEDGVNGIFYDCYDELVKIICDVAEHKDKYLQLGKNAYDYYWHNATPEIMAGGVIQALDYVFAKT